MRLLILLSVFLAACVDDVDEPWFLDHDRIIAVRASPPRILSGEQSTLDALIGTKGGAAPFEATPAAAMVVTPESLAGTVSNQGGAWTVTAPDEATLVATRIELGLEPGAPVPLQVGVGYPGTLFPSGAIVEGLAAIKTVWLGEHAENPTLTGITIDGVAGDTLTEIVIGKLVDVPLSVDADEDAGDDVTWLTSCGTLHDFDLPTSAYVNVEEDDPTEGSFAVVRRIETGGVVWKIWPIRAE